MPKPGPHLQPVNDVETIFTIDLARHKSAEGDISPKAFNLNRKSKEQTPPRKSVWDVDLSTPPQIVDLLDNPDRRVAVYIDVSEVRDIDLGDSNVDVTANMDVIWDRLNQVISNFNGFPGHEGHCGIIGWPQGKGQNRVARRQIRARLAERAHRAEEVEPTQQQPQSS